MARNYFNDITRRLKLPYEVIKCRLFGIYKPLVVLFYVTDRCNLRCKYCVSNWSGRKIPDFSLDEIKKVIDECKKLGACHFTIHGGEILLRDDVAEIINYLKKNKFYVNLVSNGIILQEKIDQIMKIDSLCISLDGREENNDFTRGSGSYKAIMKAIKTAREKGLKLNVHAAITKRNIGDIEFLAKAAKEAGYYQQFSLLLMPLNETQKDMIGLTDEESKAVIKQIIKLKKEGYPIFTSYRTLNNALNWPYSYDKARLTKEEFAKNNNLIRCYYGKLKIAIDADGRVYPCSSLNDSFTALNVKEVGVKKAYEHVLKNNDCEACFYLTQNDWSLLLGGSMRQFFNQAVIQLQEVLNIFKK